MIPRFKPQYGLDEWLAALAPTHGNIPLYESAFANKFGCSEGIMFAHGRSAIYALLKEWGLENVEVICPAYTCVVVPNAIVLSGNVPVFVDCEDGGFNMSIEGIRQALTEKTRVIIPTHLFGYAMDVHAIDALVHEAEKKFGHKIYVIQDCAHSFGAKWQGELVTRYGDAAIFGLNISKIINSIFGGMVITQDADLAKKLRDWRSKHTIKIGLSKSFKRLLYFMAVNIAFNSMVYGLVNWLERKGLLDRFTKYYEEDRIDFPDDWDQYPSEIEARIGLMQLSKYDAIIEKRKHTARKLIDEMAQRDDILILPYNEQATYSHIVARVNDRDAWVEKYRKQGIQLGILIEYSIPMMKAYEKYRKTLPVNANRYAQSMINFPVYYGS